MNKINSREECVLITGGTSGLGLELVKLFMIKGYSVVATGRKSPDLSGFNGKFKLFPVDFNNMSHISEIINEITEIYKFSIVINNAGVLSRPEYTTTVNGFEYTFQVNLLSHLLINELILRKAKSSDPIRIAAVTSPVYKLAISDLSVPYGEDKYRKMRAYTSSKLYQTLMCEFLPVKFSGLNLQCFSFNPGTFSSGIYRMQKAWFRGLYQIAAPFMRSPSRVAEILVRILSEEEIMNGKIYNLRKKIRQVPVADKHKKEEFLNECYTLIGPFLTAGA